MAVEQNDVLALLQSYSRLCLQSSQIQIHFKRGKLMQIADLAMWCLSALLQKEPSAWSMEAPLCGVHMYTFCPQDLASSFGLQVCCEQAVHNLTRQAVQSTLKALRNGLVPIVPAFIPLHFFDLKDHAGTTENF